MSYESKPMGNRLGIYAAKVEVLRHQRGLDDRGFPVKQSSEQTEENAETED